LKSVPPRAISSREPSPALKRTLSSTRYSQRPS
jgi:hypothetical protein